MRGRLLAVDEFVGLGKSAVKRVAFGCVEAVSEVRTGGLDENQQFLGDATCLGEANVVLCQQFPRIRDECAVAVVQFGVRVHNPQRFCQPGQLGRRDAGLIRVVHHETKRNPEEFLLSGRSSHTNGKTASARNSHAVRTTCGTQVPAW